MSESPDVQLSPLQPSLPLGGGELFLHPAAAGRPAVRPVHRRPRQARRVPPHQGALPLLHAGHPDHSLLCAAPWKSNVPLCWSLQGARMPNNIRVEPREVMWRGEQHTVLDMAKATFASLGTEERPCEPSPSYNWPACLDHLPGCQYPWNLRPGGPACTSSTRLGAAGVHQPLLAPPGGPRGVAGGPALGGGEAAARHGEARPPLPGAGAGVHHGGPPGALHLHRLHRHRGLCEQAQVRGGRCRD